jgi:CelD/BcsL family acetyltransferase involved in cellulose biosynthesis
MLAKLRARGVTAFDFMGRIEPYKLRWSDSNGTYLRREVRIYPPTLAGYLAFGKQATRHAVRLWRDRDRTAKVPEDPKRP